MPALSNEQTPTQRAKQNKDSAKIFSTKEQDKSPETNPNKVELYDLPGRVFKIAIIKMLTSQETNVRISTKGKYLKVPNRSHGVKENKTTLKNLLEVFKNRLAQVEEKIGKLKDRSLEIIQSEEQK